MTDPDLPFVSLVRCVLCGEWDRYDAIACGQMMPLWRNGNIGPVYVHAEPCGEMPL